MQIIIIIIYPHIIKYHRNTASRITKELSLKYNLFNQHNKNIQQIK